MRLYEKLLVTRQCAPRYGDLVKMALYEPPYTIDQIREEYGDDVADRLSKDPVHKWRADTGIELIHREPDLKEFVRIVKNWKLMDGRMRYESDKKSKELFGKGNMERVKELMEEYASARLNKKAQAVDHGDISRLVHLSSLDLDGKVLEPRVPKNEFVDWGVEDGSVKRISFAPSIHKALTGIGRNVDGKILGVYVPDVDDDSDDFLDESGGVVHPTREQVPDVGLTGEVWVTRPVRVKRLKKILVTGRGRRYLLSFLKKDGTAYTGHPSFWRYRQVKDIDSEKKASCEQYTSGSGKVESYKKDKTKDHDEIVLRLKDGRRVVISNNTKLGIRVEPKEGDEVNYHGYGVKGTNVVHKVHPNKSSRGGWLEHVKKGEAMRDFTGLLKLVEEI